MNWFGLGKPRSKFGEYIDSKGISQQELSDKTGVNRNTISQLANDENARPSWKVERRIMDFIRDNDDDASGDDWGW